MASPNSTRSTLVRPMPPRDPHEPHRVATPLELFFDLISVIAISAASAGLHHAIADGHAAQGIIRFIFSFFAIWWAWMNYTWFASAYDNDDTLFRLLTMVTMAGALTVAAGITRMFESLDLTLVIIGYIVMRLAMVVFWLRAARNDPARRNTALSYAIGIALVQIYWIGFYVLQPRSEIPFYALFVIGAALELLVPVLAEKKNYTLWHRHHIVERYGLLNIIVLGETLLAGSIALRSASGEHFDMALLYIALSALVILFSMWWLYFAREEQLETHDLGRALTWGYGHAVIFASGAAVGAGVAVRIDIATHHAKIGALAGEYAVAIPLALYMLGLWFVRDRFVCDGPARYVLPTFGVLIVLAPLTPLALQGVAILAVLCVVVRNYLIQRQ
ncbi:MAG TPA: low temperature requirement protein A [Hyphomicrobiales bacterium]